MSLRLVALSLRLVAKSVVQEAETVIYAYKLSKIIHCGIFFFQGAAKPIEGSDYVGEDTPVFGEEVKYIFVRLTVLREYLRRDLAMPNLPFPYDFERAIDDWVFMCFFVGNDFLPHLPSLEIRENAIDRLVKLYKEAVFKTGVS